MTRVSAIFVFLSIWLAAPHLGGAAHATPGLAKPDAELATPFFLAAQAGDVEVMRLLVANGADPNLSSKDATTPLSAAAGMFYLGTENVVPESAYLEAAKLCLALGIDVNAANDRGNTALHGNAFGGLTSITQLLVDHGVNLSVVNKAGRTPLAVARHSEVSGMRHTQPAVAALLEKHGAK